MNQTWRSDLFSAQDARRKATPAVQALSAVPPRATMAFVNLAFVNWFLHFEGLFIALK